MAAEVEVSCYSAEFRDLEELFYQAITEGDVRSECACVSPSDHSLPLSHDHLISSP